MLFFSGNDSEQRTEWHARETYACYIKS